VKSGKRKEGEKARVGVGRGPLERIFREREKNLVTKGQQKAVVYGRLLGFKGSGKKGVGFRRRH